MKTIQMISILCSLLLSGCGELDSSSSQSQAAGIHSRSKSGATYKAKVASLPSPFSSAKSPDGFLPAAASSDIAQKAASFPKDKHGMATYPLAVRQRYVRTTAYSHEEREVGAPWKKNAIGTNLKYGRIRSAAADWSRYPVGTKFKIKGLPNCTYVVDDYGSALVGTNTVDIYHPTLRTMRRWGTRKTEIVVTEWGDWERALKILEGRKKYSHTRKMYYAAKAKVDSGEAARNR